MNEPMTAERDDWQVGKPNLPPAAVVCGLTIISFAFALHFGKRWDVWLLTLMAAAVSLSSALLLTPHSIRRSATRVARWDGKSPGRVVASGVAAGLALSLATTVGYQLTAPWWTALRLEAVELYGMMTTGTSLAARLAVLSAVVLTEELVWRGVLVRALEKRWSTPRIVVVATLAYSLPQVASGSWLLVLVALGCGLVWTVQRVWTGSLTFPLITHIVWDLWVFFLFPLVEVPQ